MAIGPISRSSLKEFVLRSPIAAPMARLLPARVNDFPHGRNDDPGRLDRADGRTVRQPGSEPEFLGYYRMLVAELPQRQIR